MSDQLAQLYYTGPELAVLHSLVSEEMKQPRGKAPMVLLNSLRTSLAEALYSVQGAAPNASTVVAEAQTIRLTELQTVEAELPEDAEITISDERVLKLRRDFGDKGWIDAVAPGVATVSARTGDFTHVITIEVVGAPVPISIEGPES